MTVFHVRDHKFGRALLDHLANPRHQLGVWSVATQGGLAQVDPQVAVVLQTGHLFHIDILPVTRPRTGSIRDERATEKGRPECVLPDFRNRIALRHLDVEGHRRHVDLLDHALVVGLGLVVDLEAVDLDVLGSVHERQCVRWMEHDLSAVAFDLEIFSALEFEQRLLGEILFADRAVGF